MNIDNHVYKNKGLYKKEAIEKRVEADNFY
jgi:hypothetical protein